MAGIVPIAINPSLVVATQAGWFSQEEAGQFLAYLDRLARAYGHRNTRDMMLMVRCTDLEPVEDNS